jgi:hypothetical protein
MFNTTTRRNSSMTLSAWVWIGIIIFALFTCYKFAKHKFIYKKERPHVRYCASCGQKQIEVHNGEFMYDVPLTYWIDSGSVKDENCHCHDYTNI